MQGVEGSAGENQVQEHPIQGLMRTAMESIKEMVEVSTVVGEPVEAQDGSLVVPVSKVCFGFAAGGGEYNTTKDSRSSLSEDKGLPFGGGTGAGATVQPMGFLVVGPGDTVRFLPVESNGAVIDRLIDLAPQVLGRVQEMIQGDASARNLPQRGTDPQYREH